MINSTMMASKDSYLMNQMSCYLQTDILRISFPEILDFNGNYQAQHYQYQLPQGQFQLLKLMIFIPNNESLADIQASCKAIVNSVHSWHESHSAQHIESSADNLASTFRVLVVDIQFQADINHNNNINNQSSRNKLYNLIKELLAETRNILPLQVFSWRDWYATLETLKTPCELWRFLYYRLDQIKDSLNQFPSDFENRIVTEFLNRVNFFEPAITVDNALIKYGLQNEPNSALVAMSLAQKTNSSTKRMYQHHMQQAAELWSQLSMQMIETVDDELESKRDKRESEIKPSYWQQQLLDESLFSRHELIRTLYRHPKQEQRLQKEGYVVHQHSYECLGRHYVLIFYGQDAKGRHSKSAIRPNLSKIALDVATRLPIAELHHVVVLGIDFIIENEETFLDIDLWIQPVQAMTKRERQLTRHIQQLQQKN